MKNIKEQRGKKQVSEGWVEKEEKDKDHKM